ncbi:hypothetical protein GJQ54_05210 [Oceanospirillaceae bacterium ASx5O]|nr:hypothetical protein GJQ54_05210 [Oceanospirillaceae bacterium ASx5O]
MAREIVFDQTNARQAMTAIKALVIDLLQGGPVAVLIRRPSRSREQEKKYHAMFREFARQVTFCRTVGEGENVIRIFGQGYQHRYDEDCWKALLVHDFAQERAAMGEPLAKPGRVIPVLDNSGMMITVRASTAALSREESAAFIEYLYAKGIEYGVRWPASAEEIAAAEREWINSNRRAA